MQHVPAPACQTSPPHATPMCKTMPAVFQPQERGMKVRMPRLLPPFFFFFFFFFFLLPVFCSAKVPVLHAMLCLWCARVFVLRDREGKAAAASCRQFVSFLPLLLLLFFLFAVCVKGRICVEKARSVFSSSSPILLGLKKAMCVQHMPMQYASSSSSKMHSRHKTKCQKNAMFYALVSIFPSLLLLFNEFITMS